MKRWMQLLLLLCFLLAGCQSQASPAQVTQLQHGTLVTSVEGQVIGQADPAQGSYLLLTVRNDGQGELLLAVGRDTANGVVVSPGETGSLSHTLGKTSGDYDFRIYAAAPGSPISAAYTLTQSDWQAGGTPQ